MWHLAASAPSCDSIHIAQHVEGWSTPCAPSCQDRMLQTASWHTFTLQGVIAVLSVCRGIGNVMSNASTGFPTKAGNTAADGCTRALRGELLAAMLPVSHLPRWDAEWSCQASSHRAVQRWRGQYPHPVSWRVCSHAGDQFGLPLEGADKAFLSSQLQTGCLICVFARKVGKLK